MRLQNRESNLEHELQNLYFRLKLTPEEKENWDKYVRFMQFKVGKKLDASFYSKNKNQRPVINKTSDIIVPSYKDYCIFTGVLKNENELVY